VTTCWLVGPVALFNSSNEYTALVEKCTAGKTEELRMSCYWILWQATIYSVETMETLYSPYWTIVKFGSPITVTHFSQS